MTNIAKYNQQLPVPAAASPVAFGKVARMDRAAMLTARQDYNDAKVALHRIQLETIVEKAETSQRAELASDAMLHARAIDDLVTQISAGKPTLELALRDIQQAHLAGESTRIIRRGYGF